jgi:hypothetical protein
MPNTSAGFRKACIGTLRQVQPADAGAEAAAIKAIEATAEISRRLIGRK